MIELVGIGLALTAAVWLVRHAIVMDRASQLFVDPITTRRQEPCWTEEIIGADGLAYGRSQCVNDTLMDVDALARESGFGAAAD